MFEKDHVSQDGFGTLSNAAQGTFDHNRHHLNEGVFDEDGKDSKDGVFLHGLEALQTRWPQHNTPWPDVAVCLNFRV